MKLWAARVCFQLRPPCLGHPSSSTGREAANLHRRGSSHSIRSLCMEGGCEQHPRDPVPWGLAPPELIHPHADSTRVVKSCSPGPSSIKEITHSDLSAWQHEGQLGVSGTIGEALCCACATITAGCRGFHGTPEGEREGLRLLPTLKPFQQDGRETSCVLPQLSFLRVLAGGSRRGEEDVGT